MNGYWQYESRFNTENKAIQYAFNWLCSKTKGCQLRYFQRCHTSAEKNIQVKVNNLYTFHTLTL